MFWNWKRKALTVERDWEQLYQDTLAASLNLQQENIDLHSAEADFILWIERICTLIPTLRLRSGGAQPVIKTQLGLLLAEAEEKGWIVKKEKAK
jgi:hypothetical protein